MTEFCLSSLWLIVIFYTDNVQLSAEQFGAQSIFNLTGWLGGQIKIIIIAGRSAKDLCPWGSTVVRRSVL